MSYAANNTAHLFAVPSMILLALRSPKNPEQIFDQLNLFIDQSRQELFLKFTSEDTQQLAHNHLQRFTQEGLITESHQGYSQSTQEKPMIDLITAVALDTVRRRVAYLMLLDQGVHTLEQAAKHFSSLSQEASKQPDFSHSNWLDQSLLKNYARQLISSALIVQDKDKVLSLSKEAKSVLRRLSGWLSTAEIDALETVYAGEGSQSNRPAPEE